MKIIIKTIVLIFSYSFNICFIMTRFLIVWLKNWRQRMVTPTRLNREMRMHARSLRVPVPSLQANMLAFLIAPHYWNCLLKHSWLLVVVSNGNLEVMDELLFSSRASPCFMVYRLIIEWTNLLDRLHCISSCSLFPYCYLRKAMWNDRGCRKYVPSSKR